MALRQDTIDRLFAVDAGVEAGESLAEATKKRKMSTTTYYNWKKAGKPGQPSPAKQKRRRQAKPFSAIIEAAPLEARIESRVFCFYGKPSEIAQIISGMN